MSQNNKRNDNMQDYLELLEEYGSKDEEITSDDETIIEEESDSEKRDFFEDYNVDDEEVFGKPYSKQNFYGNDQVEENKKEKNIFKRLAAWFNNLPKGKKIAVSIIAIILAIIIVLSVALGIFINSKFEIMGDGMGETSEEDVIYDEQEFDNISGQIGSADFNQALRDWATTGNNSHMSSKNVINVLLIGADKKSNSGNTDVMMVVSVNRKTKQLKLVSFLRDSYLYIEGKKSSYCTKLNAAYSMGGPETLIQTIENNYKIDIDNYVMVNFKSFEKIIDAMGGITVDVKKYEADYNYKKFKIHLPYGDNVKLNGEEALCFVRIRGCDADGDVSRTRRQRQVINAMLDRVMNSSISELNKYINVLLPYVDTGYSKSQIVSLGIKALAGGWAKYERTQLQMPPEDCRTSGSANGWVWVVDYQKAANILQTELFGTSNILLPENRTTIIDVYRGANYSSNSNTNKDEPATKAPVNDVTGNQNVDVTEETTDNLLDIPDSTNPIETEPTPTEPISTEPTPTQPSSTEPKPTEAETTPTPTESEE